MPSVPSFGDAAATEERGAVVSYPFGERLGVADADVYRTARSGLRSFRHDAADADPWFRESRDHKTSLEFMSCARGNLWRVVTWDLESIARVTRSPSTPPPSSDSPADSDT